MDKPVDLKDLKELGEEVVLIYRTPSDYALCTLGKCRKRPRTGVKLTIQKIVRGMKGLTVGDCFEGLPIHLHQPA